METKGESLLHGLEHMLERSREGPAHPCPSRARSRSAATSRRRRARWSSRPPLYQLIQYAPATERGAGDAADHLPALDQPLLHPRSQPEEELHQMGGGAGADRVRRLVEIGRREHGRRDARRLCRWPRSRRSTRCARRSASRACTRSAIAWPGRCWRRRWRCSRRGARRTRSRARPSSPRRSISRRAGDLKLFIGDEQMELIRQLSADKGYLDGRYMAATFNLLRGRDLIWNYVTNNYLLGEDYPQFDLLHWNGDTTNLPAELAPRLSPAALPREQAGPARRDRASTACRSTCGR